MLIFNCVQKYALKAELYRRPNYNQTFTLRSVAGSRGKTEPGLHVFFFLTSWSKQTGLFQINKKVEFVFLIQGYCQSEVS